MFHEFGNDPGVLWLRFGRPGAFPARSLLNFNAKISPPRQVVLAPCLLTPTSYTILRPIGQSVCVCVCVCVYIDPLRFVRGGPYHLER